MVPVHRSESIGRGGLVIRSSAQACPWSVYDSVVDVWTMIGSSEMSRGAPRLLGRGGKGAISVLMVGASRRFSRSGSPFASTGSSQTFPTKEGQSIVYRRRTGGSSGGGAAGVLFAVSALSLSSHAWCFAVRGAVARTELLLPLRNARQAVSSRSPQLAAGTTTAPAPILRLPSGMTAPWPRCKDAGKSLCNNEGGLRLRRGCEAGQVGVGQCRRLRGHWGDGGACNHFRCVPAALMLRRFLPAVAFAPFLGGMCREELTHRGSPLQTLIPYERGTAEWKVCEQLLASIVVDEAETLETSQVQALTSETHSPTSWRTSQIAQGTPE